MNADETPEQLAQRLVRIGEFVDEVNKAARVPRMDMVICPGCTHQFRAIPAEVQARIAELEVKNAELEAGVARALLQVRGLAEILNDALESYQSDEPATQGSFEFCCGCGQLILTVAAPVGGFFCENCALEKAK